MSPRVWRLSALIGALLLASFLYQLPSSRIGGVADWQEFAFYDPGTVLKGDMLLAKGYLPTVDFGYTHGLLSLLYGRLGFALLGRTPWTFFLLTLLCEAVIAWALARIALALRLAPASLVLLLVGLPMAILPAYLTLTHPLEAMFILLALAEQAEGKKDRALWWLTVCLFVKPSMAYVYGALLVAALLLNLKKRRIQALRGFIGAGLLAALLFSALALWTGPLPVLRTLLPITGAKTYAATGFGFFSTSGHLLWAHQPWWAYLFSSVGMVLLGAVACAAGALYAAFKKLQRPPAAAPASEPPPHDPAAKRRRELMLTVGLLETAFLLGFYGWQHSWTYYAYLLVWGLVLALEEIVRCRPRLTRPAATVLISLMALSSCELLALAADAWLHKPRPPEAGGLWVYADLWADWQSALAAAHGQPTLLMTNGWVPDAPSNVQFPDAWFPELGIPTTRELQRVRRQIAAADVIIRWKPYKDFEDVWNEPSMAPERAAFAPLYENAHFLVLQRTQKSPQSTRAAK